MTLTGAIVWLVLPALASLLVALSIYGLLLFVGTRIVGLREVRLRRCCWITFIMILFANFVLTPIGLVLTYVAYRNRLPLDVAIWSSIVVGLLASWLIIRKMLDTDSGRALVCLLLYLLPVWAPAALAYAYLGDQIRQKAREQACQLYMGYFCYSIAMYAREHKNELPADMTQLRSASQDKSLGICPCTLSAGKVSYFYMRPTKNSPKRLVVCDLRNNHGGTGRTVVCGDGSIHTRTEEAFQKDLADPINADFARALRAAESPPNPSRTAR